MNSRRRILLILPVDRTYRYRGFFKRTLSYAPLTLSTLAGLVPAELKVKVDIIDEGVTPPVSNFNAYDLVGITCTASSSPRAYALAGEFRKRGCFVVLGGVHPTLNPQEAALYCDAVVSGPAEASWPLLLEDFFGGKPVKKLYMARAGAELPASPPRRDLLAKGRYLKVASVIASRGCKNRCSFCSLHQVWNGSVCRRPLEEVIDEIKNLPTRKFLFLDPNIITDRDYACRLFESLIPLNLHWAGLATVDLARDSEMLNLAARSGCTGILTGIESVCQDSLSGCGKGIYRVNRYKEDIRQFHTKNIRVLGCFVLGFDTDTEETIKSTLRFIDETNIDIPRYSVLTPFPGTPLYDKMKSQGRILTDDLQYYDTEHVVYQPANMSPEKLQTLLNSLWQETFTYKRIFKRVFAGRQRRLLTAAVNLGFRRYGIGLSGLAGNVSRFSKNEKRKYA